MGTFLGRTATDTLRHRFRATRVDRYVWGASPTNLGNPRVSARAASLVEPQEVKRNKTGVAFNYVSTRRRENCRHGKAGTRFS